MKNTTWRSSHRITLFIMNHRILRYLFILPTILLIAHCIFSMRLDGEIKQELLNEKFLEKKQDIELISATVNSLDNRDDGLAYKVAIVGAAEYLDALPLTFAAVYNRELHLVSGETQSYATAFDPFAYRDFSQAIVGSESGTYKVSFIPDGEPAQDVLLCYRWLPENVPDSGKLLLIVGISQFSVSTPIALWVAYGNIALSAITAFCNYFMIALLLSVAALSENERINK